MLSRVAPQEACFSDLHVGHAVLGEEALLLGDDQRRGIGQRDVAELGRLGHLGPGRLRDVRAAEDSSPWRRRPRPPCCLWSSGTCAGSRRAVPEFPSCSCSSLPSSSFAVRVDLDRSPPSRSSPPKTKKPHSEVAHARPPESGVAYGWPVFGPSGVTEQRDYTQASCQFQLDRYYGVKSAALSHCTTRTGSGRFAAFLSERALHSAACCGSNASRNMRLPQPNMRANRPFLAGLRDVSPRPRS